KELKPKHGVGDAIECANNMDVASRSYDRSQDGIILQIVRARIGVARVIRCHAVATEIDAKSTVIVDGIGKDGIVKGIVELSENGDSCARVRADDVSLNHLILAAITVDSAGEITRNDVLCSRRRSPDRVWTRREEADSAGALIAHKKRAGDIS